MTIKSIVDARCLAEVFREFGLVQLIPELCKMLVAAQDMFPGQLITGLYLLGHMGQSKLVHAGDIALVGAQLAQQKGKQAGFTTAVGADKRKSLSGLNRGVGALKQSFAAAAQADIA